MIGTLRRAPGVKVGRAAVIAAVIAAVAAAAMLAPAAAWAQEVVGWHVVMIEGAVVAAAAITALFIALRRDRITLDR